MLASQLPDDARIWGNEGWGVDRELAASTLEMTHEVARRVSRLAGSKKKEPRIHIDRPEEMQKKRSKTTASKWVEFARRLRGG